VGRRFQQRIGRTRRLPDTIASMLPESRVTPPLSPAEAARIALELFSLQGDVRPLPGEYDDNFHLVTSDGRGYVLKIMHAARESSFVDMQCHALTHLAERAPHLALPRVIPSSSGELFKRVQVADGSRRIVWLLTFLPGSTLAEVSPHGPELLESLGRFLAEVDAALLDFSHSAANRILKWDLSRSHWAFEKISFIADPQRRALAEHFLNLFEEEAVSRFHRLRRSVIYGDANDHNVLVSPESSKPREVASVIDFGDLHTGLTVAEPAVAAAYAILGKDDPIAAASSVLAGYHRRFPLNEDEVATFFPLMATRLAVSVVNSAHRKSLIPEDPYVTVTEVAAWTALERLAQISPSFANDRLRAATAPSGTVPSPGGSGSTEPLLTLEQSLSARQKYFSSNLSLSYDRPLKIVRGWMQYLYDDTGRAFLDVYNNVPLVGHSHPRVVRAVQKQIALLNTNTRYLHDNILQYAERLTALLPTPSRVCFFVNSGSEANELALRLARTHTGREDVIVLEHAYHGHTSTLIDISPYKFNGPGGKGQKPWVHVAPIPDDYRGIHRRGESDLGRKYAAHVAEILEKMKREGRGAAAFIAETLPSVAGQIVFPPGYLSEVYKHVRSAGAVCIADEVQVGFGRLGTHFWGFETQGAVPDIVVLGKPIGNGFPLAAVVTTAEIAASFDTGMEFFSTFGGNPVACAAGMAVLDVLEADHLQQNALVVGAKWLEDLRALRAKYPLIGDVRGMGLFLGIELVTNREARTPASAQAHYVVNRLRDLGILAGTDGPHHNVIKLRPPLIFSAADAAFFTSTLSSILAEDPAQPA
jgi:4-aminobutyrate aminotransferase-like enzyme/Ser/Thr protein kinase RdoA (MazF antagonist)